MDLQYDEQQDLLRQSLDRYLEKRLPFEVRAAQKSGADFIAFWRALDDELGVGGSGLDEAIGGFAGGAEAEAIVAGALGRALAVTPYTASHVQAANLLAELGQPEPASRIVSDGAIAVVAMEESQTRGDIEAIETWADPVPGGWKLHGTKRKVDFAAEAELVLVPARIAHDEFALFALGPDQLSGKLKPYALIDGTPSADLLLDEVVVGEDALLSRGPAVLPALQRTLARALAALCAEAAGVAAVLVEDTVAYAKEREQFGVPIASFQALQHRMVDMWAKAREIEAASLLATLRIDDARAVAAAKATVSDGLRKIGQEAVQLHGAMGLSEELRVGHYFKRATVIEHRLGSAADHVERYRRMALPR